MPGSFSSPCPAAGLHEVLQFLGEYLAGRLRHRSHRVPVLPQLRPQLGVAERVHRHLVSQASDRVPESGARPGLKRETLDRRRSYHDVAGRLRDAPLCGRPAPLPFISIDDQSATRRLRARDARFLARRLCSLLSHVLAHVDDRGPSRVPVCAAARPSSPSAPVKPLRVYVITRAPPPGPSLSFRTVRFIARLPSAFLHRQTIQLAR